MRVSLPRAILAASVGLAGGSTALARAESFLISSGPKTISAEEHAIVDDPSAGIEGAVVLLDETDQSDGTERAVARVSRHVRAKILSDSGRSLSDVAIPLGVNGRVVNFWGRAIAPDGKISELRREALENSGPWATTAQEIRRGISGGVTNSRKFESSLSSLHGTLPGVVPGSVIDYGWTVEGRSFETYRRTPLQRAFIVRNLRHRWVPSPGLVWGITIVNDPLHRVHAEQTAGAVLVTARDLPAQKTESLAPWPSAYLASMVIYYMPAGRRADEYWASVGPDMEKQLTAYVGEQSVVEKIVTSAGVNASDDFDRKLRKTRAWLLANLTIRRVPRAEAIPTTLSDGLLRHDASLDQLEFALTAVARSLGAETEFIRARHRMGGSWQPEILSIRELDDDVLRARRPGSPDAEGIWIDTEPDVPFGSLPPEVQGTLGVAISKAEVRKIELPATPPESNSIEAVATISPGTPEVAESARWVTTYRGAAALYRRRWLRGTATEKRQSVLTAWCTQDADVGDVSAKIEAEDDPESPLELQCSIGLKRTASAASDSVLAIPVNGPWLAKPPDLPPGPRRLPVILQFTSRESTVINVQAPPGSAPGDAPQAVRFSGPFGKYELSVEKIDTGFRVSRSITFAVNEVQPADYAAFRDFIEGVREEDKITLPFVQLQPDSPHASPTAGRTAGVAD